MYIPRRLITVQGHPEFNEGIVKILLDTRHKQGIFDDPSYKEAIGRVAKEHDGGLVAVAFVEFMRDGMPEWERYLAKQKEKESK